MGKWFGKEEVEVPPELEGLTADQIIAAAKEAKELKTKVAEIDTLKAKIEDMEKNPKVVEKVVEKVVDRRQQPNNEPAQRTSFLEDEDKAFNERAAPLVNAIFTVGASSARMTFENGLKGIEAKLYTRYGKEVEELMAKEPPQNQASPYSWKTGFDIIKGRHIEEVTKAAQDKTDYFAETSSGTAGAGPMTSEDQNKLTDEQTAIAKKYGLKPEEYLEQRKGMTVYHG